MLEPHLGMVVLDGREHQDNEPLDTEVNVLNGGRAVAGGENVRDLGEFLDRMRAAPPVDEQHRLTVVADAYSCAVGVAPKPK